MLYIHNHACIFSLLYNNYIHVPISLTSFKGRALKDAGEGVHVTERGDVAGAATASQKREAEGGAHKVAAAGERAGEERGRVGEDGDVRTAPHGVSGCNAARERGRCS